MIPHKPVTLDEQIVAYLERADGCVRAGQEVIPPPRACGADVQQAAQIASWNLLTWFVVLAFLGMMFTLTWKAVFEPEL